MLRQALEGLPLGAPDLKEDEPQDHIFIKDNAKAKGKEKA